MKAQHTPTPWKIWPKDDAFTRNAVINYVSDQWEGRLPDGRLIKVGEIKRLEDAAFIVRAVNSHEELLRKINDARKIIAELTSDAKSHKKPSGKYCDHCNPTQVWPCAIVRGHYEGKAIDEAIAKAEAK